MPKHISKQADTQYDVNYKKDIEEFGHKVRVHIAVANGHCCGAKRQSGGHSGIPLFAKPYAAKGSLHE